MIQDKEKFIQELQQLSNDRKLKIQNILADEKNCMEDRAKSENEFKEKFKSFYNVHITELVNISNSALFVNTDEKFELLASFNSSKLSEKIRTFFAITFCGRKGFSTPNRSIIVEGFPANQEIAVFIDKSGEQANLYKLGKSASDESIFRIILQDVKKFILESIKIPESLK